MDAVKVMAENYALLVGVGDYSVYDFSVDQRKGTSDLPGAVSDARTFFRQCIEMGMSPSRIRILTSPKLNHGDLGPGAQGVHLGEATRSQIDAGLAWLGAAISHAKPVSGLFTFSGHGVQDDDVAICPADTTGDFDEVIDIAATCASLPPGAAGNLTMVLDCCHAGAGKPRATNLRPRLVSKRANEMKQQKPSALKALTPAGMNVRVMAACKGNQTSASSVFGGEWRGAFTWALTSAMGQWKTSLEHGVARLDASYGELMDRARKLLGALSFEQVPALSGPVGVDKLTFLHPGTEVHPREAKAEPNRTLVLAQLDPDLFGLFFQSTTGQWTALSAIDVATKYEDWAVNQTLAADLASATHLRLDLVTTLPTISNSIAETTATAVNWSTETNPSYPTVGQTFAGTYTYALPSGGTASGTLAINFQTEETHDGAAFIVTEWYNPDTSGANINLSSMTGNTITLSPVTGTYSGTCNVATAVMSY